MSSVINNDAQSITSSFVTSNFNNPSTANSLDSDDREFNPSVRGYDGLDWKSIPGFQMARHSKLDKRSFVWKHGWEVEETSTGVKFWLCKQCHKENKIKKYNSSTTQNAIAHLKKDHQIKNEKLSTKTPRLLSGLRNQTPEEQQFINHAIDSLDPQRFKVALMRWVVHDNIPFRKVESKHFREMMTLANDCLDEAGCLPGRSTIRNMIVKEFDRFTGDIIKLLNSTDRQIHISFDLWTSGNLLSLNGIMVHFLDQNARLRTFLVSLAEIQDSHTGENIAEAVAAIITKFGIQDRLGYFMLDNASNNDTCLKELAQRFNFDATQRRLRCAGHILNLAARQIIHGKNPEAFEQEAENPKHLVDELNLWRKKGPIGKIHNITVYIMRTSQRRQQFHKFQKDELHTMQPEKSISEQQHYDLIEDVDTRWNSIYSMCNRAVQLRNPIDAFIIKEESNHKIYLSNVAGKNRNLAPKKKIKPKEKPSICDDLLTPDEWTTVTQYLEILRPFHEATLKLEGKATKGKFFFSIMSLKVNY